MNKKIIEKIRKLIEHEKSARTIGSIHEAAKFAAKIQELLDQYNLSISDVDYQETRSTVEGEVVQFRTLDLWRNIFLRSVARLQGCMIVRGDRYFIVVGNEVDRILVVELFVYFEALGVDLADRSAREWQTTREYRLKRKKSRHTRDYKNSFLLGYSSALVERMDEQRKKSVESSETGLIYIGNKLADADKWVNSNLAVKRAPTKLPSRSRLKDDAFFKGVAAGQSVALTTKTIQTEAL